MRTDELRTELRDLASEWIRSRVTRAASADPCSAAASRFPSAVLLIAVALAVPGC